MGLFARFAPCVVSVHMSGAAARGRALLAAPIAFHPKTQSSFPVQHSASGIFSWICTCICSFSYLVVQFGLTSTFSQEIALTMWTGGESGLKQDSSSSQHAGDDSGLTGKAEAIDVESTQLDSVAFDSQRDPQLSGDPIEFFLLRFMGTVQ